MGLFRHGRRAAPFPAQHPVGVEGEMERFVGHLVGHPVGARGDARTTAVRVGTHGETVPLG
ncbi:hypothetical protein [Streptomyces sp. ALB3]|uniref:hypothetical protein n=1 Tax=Streptomyces sp. ALB3 TaxID=3374278 RepID=UPI0037A2C984